MSTLPILPKIKIKDYEQHISTNIQALYNIRDECRQDCAHASDDAVNKQIEGILNNQIDEEWNSVCRQYKVVKCENYFKGYTETRALVLELSKICKQINNSIIQLNLNEKLQYVFNMENSDFTFNTEKKIGEMLLPEFQRNFETKLNACANTSRWSIRKCEMSKVKVYIDYIFKLNDSVKSLWNDFIKRTTPITEKDKIKEILKKKYVNETSRLQAGFRIEKVDNPEDPNWFIVKGDMLPDTKVNIETGETQLIETGEIQPIETNTGGNKKKHVTKRRIKRKRAHSRKHKSGKRHHR